MKEYFALTNLVILVFLWTPKLQSQDLIPDLIPPSPEVASLTAAVEAKSNMFNGSAKVVIPIYTLKCRTLEIPISLIYTGGGIKVAQDETVVGLGWALDVGGKISRVIRGKPDEYGWRNNNFSFQEAFINSAGTYSVRENIYSHHQALFQLADGVMDLQPDEFHYSLPGLGGQFIFQQYSSNIVELPPTAGIINDISPVGSSMSRFEILDDRGNRFLFGNGFFENTMTINAGGTQINKTAWFLEHIEEASTGGQVLFDYEDYDYTTTYRSQTYTCMPPASGQSWCITGGLATANSGADYQTKLISRINYENIEIEFRYSEIVSGQDEKQLDEIVIREGGNELERYVFNYSVFTGDARLKLNSVDKVTASGTILIAGFEYFAGNLPSKNSYAQDHYGFYNGQANSTLIPSQWICGAYFGGALSREPNLGYIKHGTLRKVNLATKGSFTYDYELNMRKIPNPQEGLNVLQMDAFRSSDNSTTYSNPSIFQIPFSINHYLDQSVHTASVDLEYTFTYGSSFSPGHDDHLFSKFKIIDVSTGNAVFTKVSTSGAASTQVVPLNLSSGDYILEIELKWHNQSQNQNSSVDINFDYTSPSGVIKYEEYSGGLRVASIAHDPIDSDPIVYHYDYFDGVAREPYYFVNIRKNARKIQPPPGSNSFCLLEFCSYSEVSDVSPWAFETYQGKTTGYPKVRETIGDGSNGYIEYKYSYYLPTAHGTLLPTPVFNKDYRNGVLLEKSVFDQGDNLVQKTVKNFSVKNKQIQNFDLASDRYFAVNVAYDPKLPCYPETFDITCQGNETSGPCFNVKAGEQIYYCEQEFMTEVYHYDSDTYLPISESTWNYLSNGTIQSTTSYSYVDDDTYSPNTVTSTDSKGRLVVTEYIRPSDLASGGNIYDQMVEANMISVPICELTRVDGQYVAGVFNQYIEDGNGNIVKDEIHRLEISTPLASNLKASILSTGGPTSEFVSKGNIVYGVRANPIEVYKADGTFSSFIWDDLYLYPIAKAANAAYSDIAHTSFERDAQGKFNYAGTPISTHNFPPTGKNVYNLVEGDITLSSLNASQAYIVSYWSSGSGVLVNGQAGVQKMTNNAGWNYYEIEFTGISGLTISGTGFIDEVRVCPADGQMSTYTYKPLVGITSVTDARGQTQYYEYDYFGRLLLVKDADGNILSQNEYHYRP